MCMRPRMYMYTYMYMYMYASFPGATLQTIREQQREHNNESVDVRN